MSEHKHTGVKPVVDKVSSYSRYARVEIDKMRKEITTIRAQNQALLEALEAAVAQYAGYPPEVLAEIAPEWLEKAMDALKQASNQRV